MRINVPERGSRELGGFRPSLVEETVGGTGLGLGLEGGKLAVHFNIIFATRLRT